jgi:hypothetical protein
MCTHLYAHHNPTHQVAQLLTKVSALEAQNSQLRVAAAKREQVLQQSRKFIEGHLARFQGANAAAVAAGGRGAVAAAAAAAATASAVNNGAGRSEQNGSRGGGGPPGGGWNQGGGGGGGQP